MPKIIKNGKEYSGVPIEVVTAWAPTADPVQVKEPLMGNTDISSIGDGTVTGAIDTINTGLLRVARFTGISVTVDYQDSASIGYRTTEQTKVDLRTKSGFPAGRTILGGTIGANNDLYGSVVWIDGNYCVRAVSKESKTISVTVLLFYM